MTFPKLIRFELKMAADIEGEIVGVKANRNFTDKRPDLETSLSIYPQTKAAVMTPYKDGFAVIDGNHRVKTLNILKKDARVEILYFERPLTVLEIVALIIESNSKNDPWKAINYINCFAAIGDPNYKRYLSYMDKYPAINSPEALYEMGGTSTSNWTKTLRGGPETFVFNPSKELDERFTNTNFIIAVIDKQRKEYAKKARKDPSLPKILNCNKRFICKTVWQLLSLGLSYQKTLEVCYNEAYKMSADTTLTELVDKII